jgi:dTDP-4-amino-4,6-dideoxygalactose transaminase
MSLHGLSQDAFSRYQRGGSWDYAVVAAGHKYNLSDVAAAMGRVQLARATELCDRRTALADRYARLLDGVPGLELPGEPADRRSSWHLYAVRCPAERRDAVIDRLRARGVATSVHWRPLPLQPYYRERFATGAEDFPVASREWRRLISLPVFPDMSEAEQDRVAAELRAALA